MPVAKKHLVNGEMLTITEASIKYKAPRQRYANQVGSLGYTLQDAVDKKIKTRSQCGKMAAKVSPWRLGFLS